MRKTKSLSFIIEIYGKNILPGIWKELKCSVGKNALKK
jgi:hypothetical protein